MEAYKIEKRITTNGVLRIDALPFLEGELVEVIILGSKRQARKSSPSSLRGQVIEYIDPTESVAQNDWEAIK
jgi:hypothetical protein